MKLINHIFRGTPPATSLKHLALRVYFLCVLVMAGTGFAQITVTGIMDKQVYANSVSFTVASEAGYDYTAALNGNPVATDRLINVNEPQYYQLSVSRVQQSTSAEESVLIRFIVRASERGNTEWGLPVWTPYPMIDSATAEFSGSRLEIIAPAAYPMGLDIPIIARVENSAGKRTGVNGNVQASGFEDHPLRLLRGVGSVFLPAATETGILSYAAHIKSLSTSKQIAIETIPTWQMVSGTISAATDWGQNARLQITNNLTIASGATLTIGSGSVIVINPKVDITVQGHIVVNGTDELPVVFTAQNRTVPWGGFLFETAASQGYFTGTIFTASGADSTWFNTHSGYATHRKEQSLFLLANGAHADLADCYLIENQGQAGHGKSSYLTMTGCLVQKALTVGEYNNGSVTLDDTALIEFPSAAAAFADADNDALYLTGGPHTFTDCLFGWLLDDAIDAGDGSAGAVTFQGCWFESCYHEAMALSSGPRDATISDTVVLNCGQAIECGYGEPRVDATHILCTGNLVGARFGDNYDWSYSGFLDVQNSLLLFNWRDVWGRVWDNWELHLSQMDIQNNYLSAANENHPNNTIWDPQNEPNQLNALASFLPTPASTVGIGIATPEDTYAIADLEIENRIPVRLSTFTTSRVSVDYTLYANSSVLDAGTLYFTPGQTLQYIEFTLGTPEELQQLRVSLSNPVNAELTRHQQILYKKPYKIAESRVAEGDTWSYFKGTSEPPADWNQTAFDDNAWLTGPSSFGYEAGSGYQACIATKLTDMQGGYYSVYARRLFRVDDPARLTELKLTMDWDDGYIAYLNGTLVDSQYPPSPAAYNRPASSDAHEACCGSGCTPRQVDLASYIGILNPGVNVLAIQAHNGTLSSSDFFFLPTLSSVSTPYAGDFEPDGDVDLNDFAILAQAWLTQDGQNQYNPVCDMDASSNGIINIQDLAIFAQNWLAGL